MTELYEKSLKKLELDAVLSQLSYCAQSPAGKERCLALQPMTDADDIRLALGQTSAACKLVSLKGSPSFGGLTEIAPSLI